MSSLPDFTKGERYVLPVDDIIVATTFKGSGYSEAVRNVELGLTSNSAISSLVGANLRSNRLANYTGVVGTVLVATGRFYRSNTDLGLTFTLSDLHEPYYYEPTVPLHLEATFLSKDTGAPGPYEYSSYVIIPMAAYDPVAVAVADFTGDGLDDVAFHAGWTAQTGSRTIIGTALQDELGFRFGPEYVGGPACLDMKAGDVNGDGRPELICLYHTDTDLRVVVHTVDPTTLQILDPPGNDYRVGPWDRGKARLAVGKFDDDMTDAEIVVVHGYGPAGSICPGGIYCSVWVTPIKVSIAPPPPTGTGAVSFAPGVTADIGPVLNGSTGSGWKYLTGLEVATGKLDWFGGNPRDQIVVGAGMSSDSHYKGYAAVVVNFTTSTDSTGKVTNPMYISTDQVKASAYNNAAAPTDCLAGVAVGRFSPPPPTDSTGNPDPMGIPKNSQVALLLTILGTGYSQTDCGKSGWGDIVYSYAPIGTYTVDPKNNYKITLASGTGIWFGDTVYAPPAMAVGDFQGRSLRLGEPNIITVAAQVQPQFVIGAPPMHLDYFIPLHDTSDRADCYAPSAKDYNKEPTSGTGSGVTAACIQNVSAYPGQQVGGAKATCEYCAVFSTSSDVTLAGVQETTTSTSWSNEGGGSASITMGSMKPGEAVGQAKAGIQVEGHGSAKKMHTNTDTSHFETAADKFISLDVSTGADDVVLYTTQDVYLYFYPVIGQKDINGNQIYLHFSVPDQTQRNVPAPASALPWYQPPHEVGNIFSYPGNKNQLVNEYPGAAESGCPDPNDATCVSGAQAWLSTATGNAAIKWTKSQSESQTAGSVDRTEWNVGASAAFAAHIKKGPDFTIKANAYYNHNGSTVHQYTNTNKKSLAASNGFFVTTSPVSYPNSDYQVTARILGSVTPTLESGYWDQPVPMPKPDGTAGENFVPNLTLDGLMRLVYSTDMIGGSFAAGTLWRAIYGRLPDIALQHHKRWHWVERDSAVRQSDVWYFVPLYSDSSLNNLYQADNLKMKGFFINPATALEGQGPQMMTATEGEQLRLAARIYNYSLANLPLGATVKVRFYAQIQKSDNEDPPHYDLWAPDGCTLIGEYSIPGTNIGGFRTDTTVANNWAMAHTTFDTTGRGGQHLIFWVVAWAEKADGTLMPELEQHGLTSKPPEGCPANSILDMPMEFYSNNVGFYEQVFFIMPKELAAAPIPTGKPLRPFSIGALKVSPVHADLPYAGELWELEAPLQAGDQNALGVHLVHAGQGPGGRVSNTKFIPYIEAGQTYADRLTFRPLWCGPHSAIVTARPAFREPVSATLELEIACRPEDVTAFFNNVLTNASLAGIVSVNKNGQVQGQLAALQNAVLTAERLASMGATKGACEQYWQALTRVADAGNGPVAQLLEDIIANAAEQLGCR